MQIQCNVFVPIRSFHIGWYIIEKWKKNLTNTWINPTYNQNNDTKMFEVCRRSIITLEKIAFPLRHFHWQNVLLNVTTDWLYHLFSVPWSFYRPAIRKNVICCTWLSTSVPQQDTTYKVMMMRHFSPCLSF